MSLRAEYITYQYHTEKTPALDGISYEFIPGRFYGIFGSNGSGKTTLLKTLAGDINAGKVFVDDRLLNNIPVKERALLLAIAEQENETALPFTVRECIKLGCYAVGTVNEDLIDELLTCWQMNDLQDKMFTELSGGEKQRVKLLRVLAQNTPYILLDEPAASLDWARQLELYEKLRKLAAESGKCVIMVCHDLYIAPGFIDEMLLMKSGRLIYFGKPDSVDAGNAVAQAFERNMQITRTGNNVTLSW